MSRDCLHCGNDIGSALKIIQDKGFCSYPCAVDYLTSKLNQFKEGFYKKQDHIVKLKEQLHEEDTRSSKLIEEVNYFKDHLQIAHEKLDKAHRLIEVLNANRKPDKKQYADLLEWWEYHKDKEKYKNITYIGAGTRWDKPIYAFVGPKNCFDYRYVLADAPLKLQIKMFKEKFV